MLVWGGQHPFLYLVSWHLDPVPGSVLCYEDVTKTLVFLDRSLLQVPTLWSKAVLARSAFCWQGLNSLIDAQLGPFSLQGGGKQASRDINNNNFSKHSSKVYSVPGVVLSTLHGSSSLVLINVI